MYLFFLPDFKFFGPALLTKSHAAETDLTSFHQHPGMLLAKPSTPPQCPRLTRSMLQVRVVVHARWYGGTYICICHTLHSYVRGTSVIMCRCTVECGFVRCGSRGPATAYVRGTSDEIPFLVGPYGCVRRSSALSALQTAEPGFVASNFGFAHASTFEVEPSDFTLVVVTSHHRQAVIRPSSNPR